MGTSTVSSFTGIPGVSGTAGAHGTIGAACPTCTVGTRGNAVTNVITGTATAATTVSVLQLRVSSYVFVGHFFIFPFLLCCSSLKAVMVHSSHSIKAPLPPSPLSAL